jgi:uncharacterized membrane protein
MDRTLNSQDDRSPQGAFQAIGRQRWEVLLGGGMLAFYGLTRKSKAGTALAAAGSLIALSGARMQTHPREHSAEASFAINCTPDVAYRFWHIYENLPRFMRHLESVKMLDGGRSEWVATGPMQARIRWTAQITEDRENERIAWQSLPDSDLMNNGSVEFRPAPAGRGTIVKVKMEYRPPAGALGRAVATLMGKDPEFAAREALRRFKALIETGEVPTTQGQSHGPRGAHGRVEQALFREQQDQPTPRYQPTSQQQPANRRSA